MDWKDFQPTTGEQVVREQFFSMTLRDYFAAKAMQSLLLDARYSQCGNEAAVACEVSRMAGRVADAMLAERSKTK